MSRLQPLTCGHDHSTGILLFRNFQKYLGLGLSNKGSENKGTRYQGWWPKFQLQNLYIKQSTDSKKSVLWPFTLHVCAGTGLYTYKHTSTHTNKCNINQTYWYKFYVYIPNSPLMHIVKWGQILKQMKLAKHTQQRPSLEPPLHDLPQSSRLS